MPSSWGPNLGLPHRGQTLYCLNHQESRYNTLIVMTEQNYQFLNTILY